MVEGRRQAFGWHVVLPAVGQLMLPPIPLAVLWLVLPQLFLLEFGLGLPKPFRSMMMR